MQRRLSSSATLALVVSGLAVSALVVGAPAGAGAVSTGGSSSNSQIAKAGVLVSADLPAGYVQKKHDTSSDKATQKTASKIAECKKLAAFFQTVKKYKQAKSPDFDQADTTISNTVTPFPSASKARSAMGTYTAAGLPACFGKLLAKVVASQGAQVTADIKQVGGVDVGDQAVAYEGPVDIAAKDGSTARLGFGTLAVRVGRVVDVYTYSHAAETDVSTTLENAVQSSLTRLQQALTS